MNVIIMVLRVLGFQVKDTKTEWATDDILILGIRMETNADGQGKVRASVPEGKLKKANWMIKQMKQSGGANTKHLERTFGVLNHISQVIM